MQLRASFLGLAPGLPPLKPNLLVRRSDMEEGSVGRGAPLDVRRMLVWLVTASLTRDMRRARRMLLAASSVAGSPCACGAAKFGRW